MARAKPDPAPPPGPEMTAEERKKLDDWVGRLLVKPVRTTCHTGPFLRWLATDEDGEVHVYTWQPETDKELADANSYYDAAHGRGAFALPIKRGKPVARSADEIALIRGIIENRDDLTRYLVYADYLTENGNSHGDFIRVCAQLAPLSPDDPQRAELDDRWAELFSAEAEMWYRPLTDLGLRPDFRGEFQAITWLGPHGVIDRVCISRPDILPARAARLFAAAPLLRRLELRDDALDPVGFARVRQLAQIDELDISLTALTPDGLEAVCRSKYLGALRDLDLGHNPLGAAGARVLRTAPVLARLDRLVVGSCELGDEGFRELVSSPHAHRLKDLTASKNRLTSASLHALAGSRLTELTTLNLASNRFDADGFRALARVPFLSSLTSLTLDDSGLDEDCARTIAQFGMKELRTLRVANSRVGARGTAALVAAPFFAGVRTLDIQSAAIGDMGASAIAALPSSNLRELHLNDNGLTDSSLDALARSSAFGHLTQLDLSSNAFTSRAVRRFADSVSFSSLQKLLLANARFTDSACRALADSPHFKTLQELSVSKNLVRERGKATLAERFGSKLYLV